MICHECKEKEVIRGGRALYCEDCRGGIREKQRSAYADNVNTRRAKLRGAKTVIDPKFLVRGLPLSLSNTDTISNGSM